MLEKVKRAELLGFLEENGIVFFREGKKVHFSKRKKTYSVLVDVRGFRLYENSNFLCVVKNIQELVSKLKLKKAA